MTTLQGQMAEKQKQLDDQIAQLKSATDDATKILKRNNADIGADVDQLRSDIRTANDSSRFRGASPSGSQTFLISSVSITEAAFSL